MHEMQPESHHLLTWRRVTGCVPNKPSQAPLGGGCICPTERAPSSESQKAVLWVAGCLRGREGRAQGRGQGLLYSLAKHASVVKSPGSAVRLPRTKAWLYHLLIDLVGTELCDSVSLSLK